MLKYLFQFIIISSWFSSMTLSASFNSCGLKPLFSRLRGRFTTFDLRLTMISTFLFPLLRRISQFFNRFFQLFFRIFSRVAGNGISPQHHLLLARFLLYRNMPASEQMAVMTAPNAATLEPFSIAKTTMPAKTITERKAKTIPVIAIRTLLLIILLSFERLWTASSSAIRIILSANPGCISS